MIEAAAPAQIQRRPRRPQWKLGDALAATDIFERETVDCVPIVLSCRLFVDFSKLPFQVGNDCFRCLAKLIVFDKPEEAPVLQYLHFELDALVLTRHGVSIRLSKKTMEPSLCSSI